MTPAATKIYEFPSQIKAKNKLISHKKITKRMTDESIKTSYDFKRKSWERE
ncbi:hypothetical protein [Paenibacillus barengoltzii]|uniref:Uncharacterized protein n=2 Tax=Paenibacillus TaxID=44249 RepID=A0A919XUF3_9BACL|nr:hypothetical protein [Paenibacillus barengoltzii]MDU0332765.1 hypothetical protein [Paenibacillus sp. 3LSP]GIO39486.1 hypothetical protein J41TS12_43470 [Paenibacillus antibioticophila]SMF68266.1 hypothetical protein SAMN02744102_04508 [Paenibacillus barengoltzii]